MVTLALAPVIALVAATSGSPVSTPGAATAETPAASRPSEVPQPLPNCAELGTNGYFCDTYNPDWDCYEGDIQVWFSDTCNSGTYGCKRQVL